MTDIKTKLEVFGDLIAATNGVFLWRYDTEMRLLSSNSPSSILLDLLLASGGQKEKTLDACRQYDTPSLIGNSLDLFWLAAPYKTDGVLKEIYLLGPVFSSGISEANLDKRIQKAKLPAVRKKELLPCLLSLPTFHIATLLQYGILLHHCLTGEVITVSDFPIPSAQDGYGISGPEPIPGAGRYQNFAYEQEIFRAIETGNLEKGQLPTLPGMMRIGTMCGGDPLRQAKDEMIVFVALSTRAALRGGLPEETAYALSDYYIQCIEGETASAGLYRYGADAYQDLLHRVRRHQITRNGRSREIQNCISYLENHIAEKPDFDRLAAGFGYSRGYLSAKFKKEVGVTLSAYVLQQKLEQAKIWLRNSDRSISEISQALNFTSPSYFGAQFRKHTGMSPSDYRNGTDRA